jgi:multidrug efflux pump
VAVFAGMIGVTLFGLFLTPLFYVIVRRLTGNAPLRHHGGQVAAPADVAAAPVIDALPQRGK